MDTEELFQPVANKTTVSETFMLTIKNKWDNVMERSLK